MKLRVYAEVESVFEVSDEAWERAKEYIHPDEYDQLDLDDERVRYFFDMLCLRQFDVHNMDGFADLPKGSGRGYTPDIWRITEVEVTE